PLTTTCTEAGYERHCALIINSGSANDATQHAAGIRKQREWPSAPRKDPCATRLELPKEGHCAVVVNGHLAAEVCKGAKAPKALVGVHDCREWSSIAGEDTLASRIQITDEGDRPLGIDTHASRLGGGDRSITAISNLGEGVGHYLCVGWQAQHSNHQHESHNRTAK